MIRALAAIACALLLSACAADPAAVEQALASDRPPDDFWLSITVVAPPRDVPTDQPASSAYEDLPRALRPARYIIEADWALRVALGPGATDDTFPPITRQLTADQVRKVWIAVRDSSLVTPDHPALTGRGPNPAQPADHSFYVVSFHMAGDTRTLVIDARGVSDSAGAAADTRRIIDRLCDLAWITQ